MKKVIRWNSLIIVMSLVGLCPIMESSAEQPSPQLRSNQSTHVLDKELRTFAKAYAEIYSIVEAYEPSLKAPGDPKQVERIMREAEPQIAKVLEAHAFTAESFLKTAMTISADEELRAKTEKMINEERKKVRT